MSSDTPPDKDKQNDSSSEKLTKNLDSVKKLTETLTILVESLAKLIVTKNWGSLLLVIDACLFFGFFPKRGVISGSFKELPIFAAKEYAPIFWLIFAGVFLTALVIKRKTMLRASTSIPDRRERKAIKGLRAFEKNDAEIFAQLQRERDLRECLESMKSDRFRLGILMGESGCGKTSFLQAGIIPQLNKPESNHRGVYIRFDKSEPLEIIRKTLVDDLNLPKALDNNRNFLQALSSSKTDKNSDFLQLLSLATTKVDKPLVLIFDQFEQFFVHFKQESDREPFIDALKSWYSAADPLPVKILISIRGDLYFRLNELQKPLGFSSDNHNTFLLKKFSSEEATEILQVIAKSEKIQFDKSFVRQLTENELASREDGLISPLDLQVLAWIIEKQETKELQAFNRNAFQKIGGIEGLMTRFLKDTLDRKCDSIKRQAAIQVLLAMTDLDSNVRAGVLTVEDLQTKLQGTLQPSEIVEATTWLAKDYVRLISPVKRDNTVGYELAHERLIPALREVAGKELTTAERANQLLDRRVNEWLGNQCSPRYLFNRQEFRLIQQQKPYLVWGTNRPHKEILFERSRKRLRHKFIALVMVLVFFVVGMGWWYSPIGQIQQVHWELAGLSKRVSYEYRQKAAVAFAKDKSFEQALEIVESIRDSDDKAWALIAIAKTYIKLENSKQAVDLLDQALAITQQIKSLHSKTWILIAIAETYIKLENLQQAERSLDKALTSIEQMKNLSNKAETLQKITKTIGSLRNNLKTEEFLERIWNSTHQISNANDIAMILIIMAQTYLKYKNKQQAQKLLSLATSVSKKDTKLSRKAMLFQIIGMTYTELGNLQQAEESLNIAGNITEQIQDSNDKARFLITIGETFQKSAFQQIEDIELSKNTRLLEKLLEQAYISAIKIKESNDKNLVLRAIAEIYIQLENNQHKGRYLEQALVISEQIEDSFSKAQVLRTVSEMYIKVGNSKRAVQYLEQALTITEHNKDSFSKALNFEMWDKMRNNLEIEKYRKIDTNYTKQSQYSSLSIFPITRVQILTYLVKTISKLENTPKKKKLLERVLADAEQNQYSYDKAQILTIIISTQGKLNLWRQAYKTVSQCPTDECRVESLAHILTTWAEKKNLVVE